VRNIKIKHTQGAFSFLPKEFKQLIIPQYRNFQSGPWTLSNRPDKKGKVVGYFKERAQMPRENWILERGGKVWMSMTPMELESQGYHARMAQGNVLVCGLGMGALVYNLMLNRRVQNIFVVEYDPDVIEMLKSATDWFYPAVLSGKISIYNGDALQFDHRRFAITTKIDTLLVDIWPMLGEATTESDSIQIAKNLQPRFMAWWGQELDMATWISKQNFSPPPTKTQFRKYVEHIRTETGLPSLEILGTNHASYPELQLRAVINFASICHQGGERAFIRLAGYSSLHEMMSS
jgi:hypothetical protein